MITLKAKDFGGERLHVFPNWVSNGHWAIRRDQLTNGALFVNEASIKAAFPKVTIDRVRDSDETMLCAMPSGDLKPFTISQWSCDVPHMGVHTLVIHEALSAYLRESYLKLLGRDGGSVLYTSGDKAPFTDAEAVEDRTFILMPAVVSDYLTPLVSLVHLMDAAASVAA